MVDYITPLPDAPQRGMPAAEFSVKADAFLGQLPLFGIQTNNLGNLVNGWASAAESAALSAANSASTAANAPATSGSTNSSSLSISTGSKTLTIQTGKSFVPGLTIVCARTSAPNNQMVGIVQSYNSTNGSLTFTSESVSGSGTFSDWTVAVVPKGTVGIPFNTATATDVKVGSSADKTITPASLVGSATPGTFVESATIILDLATYWNWEGPLTGSRIMGKPLNARRGITYTIDLINNGSGLLSWDTCFNFGNYGLPTLSTVNGKRDSVTFRCYDDTVGAPMFKATYSKDRAA